MSKHQKFVLIDLDGTLLDLRYQPTDGRIYTTVQRLQQLGWAVGLSSDTPYEALRIWQERFGMRGPVVAERGAVVFDGVLTYGKAEAKAFARATQAAMRLAAKSYVLWSGNPVEALRDGLRVGRLGDTVVLLNNLRLCSLSYFVRRVDNDGALQIDNDRTAAVAAGLQRCYPDFSDLDVMIDDAYGIVIVSRAGATKRKSDAEAYGCLRGRPRGDDW